jgi:hypothetical protein
LQPRPRFRKSVRCKSAPILVRRGSLRHPIEFVTRRRLRVRAGAIRIRHQVEPLGTGNRDGQETGQETGTQRVPLGNRGLAGFLRPDFRSNRVFQVQLADGAIDPGGYAIGQETGTQLTGNGDAASFSSSRRVPSATRSASNSRLPGRSDRASDSRTRQPESSGFVRVSNRKAGAAGIAPVSLIPQVVLRHATCIEHGCQCLHCRRRMPAGP